MGRPDDAEKAFLMAYQRDPDNQELKYWKQKFEDSTHTEEADRGGAREGAISE